MNVNSPCRIRHSGLLQDNTNEMLGRPYMRKPNFLINLILSGFIGGLFVFSTFVEASDPLTSVRCNQFTFDATGSYDPDNEDISFLWDFGDSQTSTSPVINHVYEKSGDYNVTLSITDSAGMKCSTAKTTQMVRVNIPPFASFTAPDLVCTNQPVLLDAGASYDDTKGKLKFDWDFGDGEKASGKKRITKIYPRGGKYKIRLTVDDNSNTECSSQIAERVVIVNEPPVAKVNKKVIMKCIDTKEDLIVAFDASQTSDINNDELTYLWDFGDGVQEKGQKITHQYDGIGQYEAKLIVKDSTNLGCGTSVDFVKVKLNKAPVAKAGRDIITCAGENVTFDGTKSREEQKGTLEAKWFFGDGESVDGLKVVHSYTKPGKYQASLSVENKLNSMCPPSKDTRLVTVNSSPSVTIKALDSTCFGNKVDFDASSATDPDGDALEYYWSFGDGTILKSGPKVTHEYKQGGNYRVTVIVDDGKGSSCSTDTANTNIRINTAPVADAGINMSCCVDVLTAFDGSASSDSDGDHLTYTWDFGDGTQFIGASAQHKYSQSGSYKVILTVDDNSGTECGQSSAGFTAEVNSSPVPVINIR